MFELFLLVFLIVPSFQGTARVTQSGRAAAPQNDEMTMLISKAAPRV
jgi:hypothetical protein